MRTIDFRTRLVSSLALLSLLTLTCAYGGDIARGPLQPASVIEETSVNPELLHNSGLESSGVDSQLSSDESESATCKSAHEAFISLLRPILMLLGGSLPHQTPDLWSLRSDWLAAYFVQ